MAQQPVKDVLDEDDDASSGAGSGEAEGGAGNGAAAGAGAGGDGIEVQYADDAFDPDSGAQQAGDGEGAGADAGDGAGTGAGDGLEDGDALSAGGEDDAAEGTDADAGGAGAGDSGDGDEQYSVKVRKRIQREQRATRTAREEMETERVARIAAQKENYQTNKNMVAVLVANVSSEIKSKIAAIKVATEGGKTSEAVDLNQELNELNLRKGELDRATASLAKEPDFEGATRPNEQANQWKEKNNWFGHPKFKAESALLKDLDRRLASSGVVKAGNRSPEYFRELDKLVTAEMPELRAKLKAVFRPAANQQNQQQRARVAGVQTRGVTPVRTQASGKGRVLITKSDVANMLQFKMDPKNPEHVKEYARSKMEG